MAPPTAPPMVTPMASPTHPQKRILCDMIHPIVRPNIVFLHRCLSQRDALVDLIYQQNPDIKADSTTCPPTRLLVTLADYARYLLPRSEKSLRFRRDKAFRGLRFVRHQAEGLDGICRKFAEKTSRKAIVGFGNWSNSDPGGSIRGRRIGPVRALVRWLRRYCLAISIDEHRTSMLHHACHGALVGQKVEIKDKDGEMRLEESYSARYCKRCKKHKKPGGCCVNRDYNAACNMGMLTKRWPSNQLPPRSSWRGVKA